MIGLEALEPIARDWFAMVAARGLEATLLAVAMVALVRFGRRLSSPLRHGLLVLALLKFVLPPIFAPWAPATYLPRLPIPLAETSTVVAPVAGSPASQETAAPRTALRPGPSETPTLASGGSELPAGTVGVSPAPPVVHPTADQIAGARTPAWRLEGLLAILLAIQLAGAGLLLVRHLVQRLRLRSLATRCGPVTDPELLAAVRRAARRQGLRSTPELVSSPDRLGPAAAGLLRRRIVLPIEVVERVPAERLAPILEHEIAHHRRLDLWTDLLIFVGSLAWWMNPAYWLLAAELRRRREDCCDAAALDTVSPRTYCHCLLDIAATLGGRRPALPALAHGSLSHPLGRRIRQIMTDSRKDRGNLTLPAIALLLTLAVIALPSGTSASQEPPPPPAPTEPLPPLPWPAPLAPVGSGSIPSLPAPSGLAPLPMPAPPVEGASTVAPPPLPAPAAPPTRDDQHYDWLTADHDERLGVRDGILEISAAGVDRLVEGGLDRVFVESLDGTADRRISLAELRQWTTAGFDSGLADELAAWGQRDIQLSRLLFMVWNETDVTYLRELRQLEYGDLSFEDGIRLARYEVAADWIRAWADGGYDDLTADELVKLRRYEVEAGYAATYREAGYELSVDDLVQLQRYEVDIDTIEALADSGYRSLGADDLVQLSRYEVDATYIRGLAESMSRSFSVDEMVQMKRYAVSPEYVGSLAEIGFGDLEVDEIVQLRRYEVTAEFIARLQGAGFDDLTVDRIIRLKRADS